MISLRRLAALAFDRQHPFQLGQVPLGVLQSQCDGAIRERQLAVEPCLFFFRFVDLVEHQFDLPVAGVEAVGGRVFGEDT